MRRVILGQTGIETSCLGFGCASLGSRVDAEAGGRALADIFARGVTWFDLAPVYGAGKAEEIAAKLLRGRRSEIQICTKAGLQLAGGPNGGLRSALLPIARRVLESAGPARGWLSARLRKAAPKANVKLPLTEAVLKESLEGSLRRLGTDYVDLLALHAPDPEEVGDEAVLRALEDIVASGKARAVAVAGEVPAVRAGLAAGQTYGVLQTPLPVSDAPWTAGLDAIVAAQQAGRGVIVHSIFGEGQARAALEARMAGEPELAEAAEAAGRGDAGRGLSRLMLERAFALNPEGVVVVSMMSEISRISSVAIAKAPVRETDPLALPLAPAGGIGRLHG